MRIKIPWKTCLYYRQTLRGEDAALYNTIVEGLLDWKTEIQVGNYPDPDRAAEIYHMVLLDVPMFFHVQNGLNIQRGRQMYLHPSYGMSEEEYRKYFAQVETFVNNACRRLANRTELERLVSIHDSILRHVFYRDTKAKYEHNVLGTIIERKAVCESIAKACKLLADVAQIPCVAVSGWAADLNDPNFDPNEPREDNHVWNLVRLDRKHWYAVDVTFDLGLLGEPEAVLPRYDYFLRPDKAFAQDHEATKGLVLPACPEDYHYYRKIGRSVASHGDIRKIVKRVLSAGIKTVTFELEPEFTASDEEIAETVVGALPLTMSGACSYSYIEQTRVFSVSFQ